MNWLTLLRAWYHRREIKDLLQQRRDVELTLVGIDHAIGEHNKALRNLGMM